MIKYYRPGRKYVRKCPLNLKQLLKHEIHCLPCWCVSLRQKLDRKWSVRLADCRVISLKVRDLQFQLMPIFFFFFWLLLLFYFISFFFILFDCPRCQFLCGPLALILTFLNSRHWLGLVLNDLTSVIWGFQFLYKCEEMCAKRSLKV